MQPFDDPASEWRRALRTRERGSWKAVRRIQQGLYATDPSTEWTRLSRRICERRWVQAITHWERMLPGLRWNGTGRKKAEWPLEWRWPGQRIWTDMRIPQKRTRGPSRGRSEAGDCASGWPPTLPGVDEGNGGMGRPLRLTEPSAYEKRQQETGPLGASASPGKRTEAYTWRGRSRRKN